MQQLYSNVIAKGLGFLLCTVILLQGSHAVSAEIPSVNELTATYRAKYDAIKTIRVETLRTNLTALINKDDLLRSFGILPYIPISQIQVYHQNGRQYREVRTHWDLIEQAVDQTMETRHPRKELNEYPFDELQNAISTELAKVSNEVAPATIHIFDGKKVWQHREAIKMMEAGVARPTYSVLNPDSRSSGLLPTTFLERLLIAFPIPDLPKDNKSRLKNRLPDLLAGDNFEISSMLDEVSGNSCVLLESTSQSIWFDPQIDFAVRRRVWRQKDGKITYEVEADQFKEILPKLWLPRKILSRDYGSSQIAKGRYAGVPLYESLIEFTKIEVNQAEHETFFSVDVPSGGLVIDLTLPTLDSNGNEITLSKKGNVTPAVSYIQPADQEDLNEVIKKARLESGQLFAKPSFNNRNSSWPSILIWFNVGFLAIILGFIAYRRFSSRP